MRRGLKVRGREAYASGGRELATAGIRWLAYARIMPTYNQSDTVAHPDQRGVPSGGDPCQETAPVFLTFSCSAAPGGAPLIWGSSSNARFGRSVCGQS